MVFRQYSLAWHFSRCISGAFPFDRAGASFYGGMCNDDRDEREGERAWKENGMGKKIGSKYLVALGASFGECFTPTVNELHGCLLHKLQIFPSQDSCSMCRLAAGNGVRSFSLGGIKWHKNSHNMQSPNLMTSNLLAQTDAASYATLMHFLWIQFAPWSFRE